MDCIFCKIANKLNQAEIVYEDKDVLGFENVKEKRRFIYFLFLKNTLSGKMNSWIKKSSFSAS